MTLNGQVALVTGGAVRVGKAITLTLAQAGCDIFIHYGRSEQEARQTKQEVEALGVRVEIGSANLNDVTETQALIPQAIAQMGKIDILINNAGIFPDEDTFLNTDVSLWDKLMNVNLRAPFLLSQSFVKQLTSEQTGNIINLCDARTRLPQTDHFVYRFSKGGLWQMTEMLALELAPNIRVNGVALGSILAPPDKDPDLIHQIVAENVPLQRTGSVEMVAQTVLHLLQHDFFSGTIVTLDGGEFLA